MAAQTPQPAAEAAKAEAKDEAPKGVTLYHADGREKTVTDPSVVVDLEFNGWSQTKPKSAKK